MKKAASVFLCTEMTLRDVELLSQWMENPIITRYLNEMPGVSDSLRDLAGKIPAPLLALRFNQEGRFFLVCEKDGEAIGFVKLRPLQSRGTHEIVYAIGEESLWGRGYGKGAVRSALCLIRGLSGQPRRARNRPHRSGKHALDPLGLRLRIQPLRQGGKAAPL